MIVVGKSDSVSAHDISDGQTVVNAKKRVLIGQDLGAPNFIMRLFTLGEGGFSPYHKHDWEHEVFILSGEGIVRGDGFEKKVEAGDFVYVPPNEEHQFRSVGKGEFAFLCVIPKVEEG
jgi:quercetin dioxygenase-like cupin family protein